MTMNTLKKILFTSFLAVPFTASAQTGTALNLPRLFSDGMVLQQQSKAAVWGWGAASSTVCIVGSWNPKDTVRTTVNDIGHWKSEIQTTAHGGPYQLRIFTAGNERGGITLNDIWLGEVWICSGQSNMEWSPANGLENQKTEIEAAQYPEIRYFSLTKRGSDTPQDDCIGKWETCTPANMARRSAVAYYFGKNIHETLNVPVGLIVSAWGGTPAEVWIPQDSIGNDPVLKNVKHKPEPWWPVANGKLYNGMIHPLLPYQIAGAIWYQGESNRDCPKTYARTMEMLVNSWRKGFGKDFPFYMVQIAPFNYNDPTNGPALIREAQEINRRTIPNSGLVITNDIGDPRNIHPIKKKEVGKRLADLALAKTYKILNKEVDSPFLESATVQKQKVILTFSHAENGLFCPEKAVKGIRIAGEDRNFKEAKVSIEGNKLIVSAKEIKNPRYVSYCFDDATIGNLFNQEGLPMAPFQAECTTETLKK